tara:strand:- start:6621 stop:7178 length:558 start_codon:yes stop_codon:yes gene_type:complete
MPDRNQQERVDAALLEAKRGEIKFDDATQLMWEGLKEESQWEILQLPKADRLAEIAHRWEMRRKVYRQMPMLNKYLTPAQRRSLLGEDGDTGSTRERRVESMLPEATGASESSANRAMRATGAASDMLMPFEPGAIEHDDMAPLSDKEMAEAIKREREMAEEEGSGSEAGFDAWSDRVLKPYGEK